jgi:hypothetical protein
MTFTAAQATAWWVPPMSPPLITDPIGPTIVPVQVYPAAPPGMLRTVYLFPYVDPMLPPGTRYMTVLHNGQPVGRLFADVYYSNYWTWDHLPGVITVLPDVPTDVIKMRAMSRSRFGSVSSSMNVITNSTTPVKIIDAAPAGKLRTAMFNSVWVDQTTVWFYNKDTVNHTVLMFVSDDNGATFTLTSNNGSWGPTSWGSLWNNYTNLLPGQSIWASLLEPTVTTECVITSAYIDLPAPP